jgi:hypothetical protein
MIMVNLTVPLSGFPAEINDEALDRFFMLNGADWAKARQRHGNGNRLCWSLRLCGLRMLGFCPDDVTMAPACRPDTLVFSPLMLLPGTGS